MIYKVKGFSVVSKIEVGVLLEFPCFFYDPVDVDNFISDSSAFSKSNLYIWKFSVHVLLKTSLNDFERDLAGMWNECNCVAIWIFFGIALLWGWNENWSLQSCGQLKIKNKKFKTKQQKKSHIAIVLSGNSFFKWKPGILWHGQRVSYYEMVIYIGRGWYLTYEAKHGLLLFSPSVVPNFLRSHWLQHVRLPCPSPSPGACSNSCPLSW